MWGKKECHICKKMVVSPGFALHVKSHGKEKPCLQCGKVVRGRKKFCNCSCAAKYNINRKGTGTRRPVCLCCGKEYTTQGKKFCCLSCQMEYQYKEFIRKWLKGEVGGGHNGKMSHYVRRWLFERAENKCEALLDDGSRCGWSRVNKKTGKIPLTIHHKDGNPENGQPTNLELICPCCHSLTPTYGGLNKGSGRKSRKN